MRSILAAALLVATAWADPEPDAAIAEPARWVEPRGCASGSFRSRALPVVTEVEEAWQLPFDSVEAPPVHWDGTGYVVAQAGGKTHLVAFDLATGKERARVALRAFLRGSPLLVWDHLVMLQPDEEQITGYRLSGRKLEIKWIFRGRADARPRFPVVHDNEVYCFLGDSLARIRPGSTAPAWTAVVPASVGPPSVHGAHVFVASFGEPWEGQDAQGKVDRISDLSLAIYRRSDGTMATSQKICQSLCLVQRPTLSVMVAPSHVYIGTDWPLLASDGTASHAIVPFTEAEGRFSLGAAGLWTCRAPPAHHPTLGTLLLSPPRGGGSGLTWCADREGKIFQIASDDEQPECFRDNVTPTVLGGIVYFGSWAADVETGEILWQLPVKRVTYAAVPADGLVIVVDEGKALRAFRGRGKR